jgi:hypothetical protein
MTIKEKITFTWQTQEEIVIFILSTIILLGLIIAIVTNTLLLSSTIYAATWTRGVQNWINDDAPAFVNACEVLRLHHEKLTQLVNDSGGVNNQDINTQNSIQKGNNQLVKLFVYPLLLLLVLPLLLNLSDITTKDDPDFFSTLLTSANIWIKLSI